MTFTVGTVSQLGLDSAIVSAFYRDNWQRKIALSDPTFYEWQFKSLPGHSGVDNCVVAFDGRAGRLAGVMGLNARPFSLDGNWKSGAELTTWIVSPDYQGTGVGPQILGHIQRSYDVLIGMGISAMALPIYMRSGFRFLRAIPRFVKVFDLDALHDIATQTPLARKLVAAWDQGARPPYEASAGFGPGLDRVFEDYRRRHNLFTRDNAHLAWRYGAHPAFAYKPFAVTVPGTHRSAFVCIREELSVSGVRFAHLLDCYGDEQAMPAALAFIEDYCRGAGLQAIDFFCTSADTSKFFLAGGWFSTLDDECFQMPHLFHPPELRNPPTTSLIYWARDEFVEMCDFSKLYITKQDADFDRPTLE